MNKIFFLFSSMALLTLSSANAVTVITNDGRVHSTEPNTIYVSPYQSSGNVQQFDHGKWLDESLDRLDKSVPRQQHLVPDGHGGFYIR